MERVRDRRGRSTERSARPGSPRSVSGVALKEGMDQESQRQNEAVGDCGAGGQNRSTGRGDGPQSDIRGRLSRLFLWVSSGTSAPSGAGRAVRGVEAEESELGARHGPEGLFRQHRKRTPDGNGRAADRRSENPAIDPKVAQRGSDRGGRMVGDGERDPARGGDDSPNAKDNLGSALIR